MNEAHNAHPATASPTSPPAIAAEDARLARAVAWIILLLTALRLVFAPWTELLPEETYYWMYWKHPSAGYFDHPPMVAWAIGAGTLLFGDTALGVRFVTILLYAASAGLVFLLGRDWAGTRAGLLSALAYALIPVFAGAGFIVTPDQALLFFWLGALCAFTRAVRSGRWGWWLLGGVSFGGALLSKYYAVLLGPSLLLFLVLSPRHRRWLLRPHPWVAFAVALACFAPVIVWNSQNDWDSFLFHAGRTSGETPHTLRNIFRFWVVQAGVLTPLVLVWFGAAVVHGARAAWKTKDEAWIFALSFSLPLFLLFAAAAFKTEVHVNWTAPAFLSLLPATAGLTLDRWTRAGRAWKTAALASGALCAFAFAVGLSALAWGAPRLYEPAGGWRALAGEVKSAERALAAQTARDPFILGADKYDLASQLAFYLGEPFETVNDYAIGRGGLSFRYWIPLEIWQGRPAVAVLDDPSPSQLRKLRKFFTSVGDPRRVETRGPGFHRRVAWIVICDGFRGPLN